MSKFVTFFKKAMPVLVIVALLVVPMVASAQRSGIGVVPEGELSEQGIVNLIQKVVNFLIFVSGAIAVIFVVISGLMYIFSGGDAEKAGKARSMLLNGLIGLAIIIGAYVIVQTVASLVINWLGGGN
jgi:Type IV secretion system pilin